MRDYLGVRKGRYRESIAAICAKAGRSDLTEEMIRQGHGEQRVAAMLRRGEADRLAKSSNTAPTIEE